MLTTFARIAKILKGLIEPRNWVEEAFANISGGGGGGGEALVAHGTLNDDNLYVLDKTWKEMKDASITTIVYERTSGKGDTFWNHLTVRDYRYSTSLATRYTVETNEVEFLTNSENGYPVATGVIN